jgi:hypothetical protein
VSTRTRNDDALQGRWLLARPLRPDDVKTDIRQALAKAS